jgi:hypothetical protein
LLRDVGIPLLVFLAFGATFALLIVRAALHFRSPRPRR